MAPLGATIWECEKLRCNLCGEVFTAKAPEEVGDQKYDETATAMVGLLKYGSGLPFNRIKKLQAGMGIPLPATTQWEMVKKGACDLEPIFEELVRYAVSFRQECVVKKNLRIQAKSIRQGALGCLKMQVFADNSKASNFEEKERPRYVYPRG